MAVGKIVRRRGMAPHARKIERKLRAQIEATAGNVGKDDLDRIFDRLVPAIREAAGDMPDTCRANRDAAFWLLAAEIKAELSRLSGGQERQGSPLPRDRNSASDATR